LLSDFGLAKIVESTTELTGSGVGMGTPAYMSPEQGMGKKVDHRTDIYALGIILYEMLTGQVPHRAETPIATVFKRINEPLPLPRSLNPNIPEAVERVLLKTLAPDPAQRFDSAGEMAAALKSAFGSKPGEIMTGLDKTQPSTSPSTNPFVAEPTRVSAPLPPRSEISKAGLPLNLLGFGAIGLLLVLVLIGIGILIIRQQAPTTPSLSQVATATPSVPKPQENPQRVVAASTHTPSPIPPTQTPTSTSTPPPPTASAVPVTAPAAIAATRPVAAPMTGQEIHDLALAEAVKWQPDAVLSEIGTTGLGPLDAQGKSTSWLLKFWSPSTKGFNSITFMNGTLTSMPSDLPVPKAITVSDKVILDTQRLYNTAEAAGAAKFTAQGYRPTATLVAYPLDESRLTWYFNYQGGDYKVVYTVILDALSGEVIQKTNVE
jgi:serine/threonine protein kinase